MGRHEGCGPSLMVNNDYVHYFERVAMNHSRSLRGYGHGGTYWEMPERYADRYESRVVFLEELPLFLSFDYVYSAMEEALR